VERRGTRTRIYDGQVKTPGNPGVEVTKMKRIIFLKVTAISLLIFTVCFAIETKEPNDGNTVGVKKPRPRVEIITMVDFYMRDGNTVSGKLLSDDKNQLVVEEPQESTVIVRTYSKRDVDTRTVATRTMPESQYYSRLGEYFAAKTWDFKDDPDEFIQAIRCYEKAKQSLEQSGAEPEKIAEIDKAIQKIQHDKEVWTEQVGSRAKLKKLEYDAEAENRLKQLEKQVTESNVKLNESIKYLDKVTADVKNDYQRLEKNLTDLNKDYVEQVRNLQAQINDNRAAINDLSARLFIITRTPGH
jgi:hypothetical protein